MNCEACTNKSCLNTEVNPKEWKPCKEIENELKKEGIYGREWIRPVRSGHLRGDGKGKWKEVPFSSLSRINNDKNPYLNDKE